MRDAGSPRRYGTGLRSTHAMGGVCAVAFLLACASPVVAQTEASADAPMQSAAPVGADGLREDGFYLEADQVAEDRSGTRRIIARGNVQARYQGRTLRANEIVYETETGVVTARGNAQIINPDGTVQYADEIQLDEDLRAGIATGFATRLEQNAKLAAASAVRRSETVNELNRAIFTPCDICTEDGAPKTPSWDIRADQVVQDRDNRVVYYRNAQVRMFGVPVLYAPVFWHPDPTAERQSGFLMPEVSLSDARGLSYEQPYLWVISPSQDLEVSPQINTKVNPLLNLDWRKRFWSGSVNARLGYTYEQDFDDDGDKFGEQESRGYILADGRFAIDRNWRWGFAVERTSDDTFFDRYDIGGVYQERGLYLNDSRRLLSQVYTVRQSQRSYLSIAALSFQSLRFVNAAMPTERENDDALPLVAPIIEGRWEPEGEIAGGRLRVYGSAVAIEREEQFLNPFAPALPGTDSRRASTELDWRRALTLANGLRVEPFLSARADAYDVSEQVTHVGPGGAWYLLHDAVSQARANVTAGVDLRYPLMRRSGDTTIVIEPMAQIAASPDSDLDPLIPNEDSLVVEIDDTNLFRANRFPGFDLYEGG
ncbi:MAG TPA: LPS assembly protein LptD, partial [Caulobacteraceae bacterium]|nr:LPS assembly protein LptD [Caulobacteraceae bacterium]